VSDSAAWPARRSAGGEVALWVAGFVLFAALAALVFGGSREPGLGMVLLCAVGAVLFAAGAALMLWAIAYRRLTYVLTDSALRIQWFGRTLVVPYGAILGIYTGQRLAGHSRANQPRWPGINIGSTRVRGLGRLRFFATSTDQSLLTMITVEQGAVIISAADPLEFRAALIERVESSTDVSSDPETWSISPPTTAPWTAVADPWSSLSAASGVLVLLVILTAIAIQYDSLADQIVIRFDSAGNPSQIASRFDLLRLPLFGVVLLAMNSLLGIWVHPRDRLLARLLWVGGAIVQVVLLIGVLRLVT
jgi:hypothetical protein